MYGRPLRWVCAGSLGRVLGLLHTVTLPSPWALGGQHLTPFFLQGLLEERDNQVFFGEVGRQMVTGLMTRAEKVAGVGLFQIFLPTTSPSETLFLAGVCFVLLTVDWLF